MAMNNVERRIRAFGWSLVAVNVLSALLVPLKEGNPVVMELMKKASGHHWLTHGALVLLSFVALGLLLGRLAPAPGAAGAGEALATAILVSTVAGGLVIGLYFLL